MRPIDPYRIWLAEIMLQQTRVETVVGYYERFLARFPTVRDLADAKLDEVLALWAGLGYYARARNLHRAAISIRDAHGARFPSEPAAIAALPGIGRYTAGAILSQAFEKRAPIVDGNVARVFARLDALDGHAKEKALLSRCWELAAERVPAHRPGDFNQALMELGATVCTPSRPLCCECPLAGTCRARALGRVEEIPGVPPRAKRPHRRIDCALLERDGRVLLVKRPERGLLGGLWELPSAERKGAPAAALARELGRTLGLALANPRRHARVEHAFTHFDMTLEAFTFDASGDPSGGVWVARERIGEYGIGAAMKRVIVSSAAAPSRGTRRARRTRAAS